MKIVINGNEKEINEKINLKQIIEQFCRNNRHIIAEVNGTIIKSPQWEGKTIRSGDTIELVNFVGGG